MKDVNKLINFFDNASKMEGLKEIRGDRKLKNSRNSSQETLLLFYTPSSLLNNTQTNKKNTQEK